MPDIVPWSEVVLSLAVGIGLAAAVGLRIFVPLLVLGGAGRLGWITLEPDFVWLASNTGLATLLVATTIEVGAYYVPTLDNAIDFIAAPAAFVAGALALAAVTGDMPPPVRWSLAVIAGGGTAGAIQGLTAFTRLKSTAFTAGLANPIVATFELVGATGVALLAVIAPLVAIACVVLLVITARRMWNRLRPVPPRA